MNTREKNKYEMLGSVSAYYEENKSHFTGMAGIIASFADITSIQKEISLNEKVIQEGTRGKVVSKDLSQEELIKTALVFAGAIYGYAAALNNPELLTFSDISSRTFSKLRDSEIPITVEKLLDKADELADVLISYGITEEKRTEARSRLNDYIDKFGSVSTGKQTKKSSRETIEMLFNKADRKLKVLDKLMFGFKESNGELYSKYSAARVIFDKTGSRKTAAETNTANTPAANS